MKITSYSKVIECKNGSKIYFGFSDFDYEEMFQTFKEMKKFAIQNYRKKHQNDILYSAALYVSDYEVIEPITGVKITNENDLKDFEDKIIKEYSIN